jgi:hypothetical protein
MQALSSRLLLHVIVLQVLFYSRLADHIPQFAVSLFICFKFKFNKPVPENNDRVYVLDGHQWALLGRYQVAIEDDAPCQWTQDDNGPMIHFLIVSLI